MSECIYYNCYPLTGSFCDHFSIELDYKTCQSCRVSAEERAGRMRPEYLLKKLQKEAKTLRAQNEMLLEALEVVEWMPKLSEMQGVIYYCPVCGCLEQQGHRDDCKLGKALKLVRGEK